MKTPDIRLEEWSKEREEEVLKTEASLHALGALASRRLEFDGRLSQPT